MEERQPVSTVLISPHRELREAVRDHLAGRPDFRLDVELTHPFTMIDAGYLEDVKLLAPGVVFLDLDSDLKGALDLAQLISDEGRGARVFGIGTPASPELLLQAMRAGVSEYFTLPLDRAVLDEALDHAAHKAPAHSLRPSGTQVLTFFSTKGGSGASMLASNVAVALRRAGHRRVLLVDLDLEMGDLALYLGVKPKYSILDLAKNLHRMDENLLTSFLVQHPSGIRLLASPSNPDRDGTLSAEQVRQIFNFLKSKFDYVVVDTSNALQDYTLSALDQTDRLCLVTNVDLPSLRNTQRCFHLLERLGYARESIKLIVNRYHAKGPIKLPAIEQTLNFPVFHVLPNDYRTVILAINTGEPFAGGSETPIAREVTALAEALALESGRPHAEQTLAAAANSGMAKGLGKLFTRLGRGTAAPAKPREVTVDAR